jgi:autotransporter translocation and assembly factor TamB
LFVPVLLVLLVVGGWHFLVRTEAGAERLWSLAEAATGGALSAASVRGDLASGLMIDVFRFENDAVTVRVARLSARASVGLLPLSVTVSAASAAGIEVEPRGDAGDQGDDTDFRDLLARLKLPLRLVVADLAVEDFVLAAPGGEPGLVIDEAYLSGRWSDVIDVERVDVTMARISANAHARLDLDSPFDLEIYLDARSDAGFAGLDLPLAVSMDAEGTLEDFALNVVSSEPSVTVRGRVQSLPDDPAVDLVIDVPSATWPLQSGDPVVAVNDARLALNGRAASYRLDADARVGVRGLATLSAALEGGGDLNTFTAERISARHDGGEISGNARFSWADVPSVSADLALASVNLAEWIDAWTGGHRADGTVGVDLAPGRLLLRDSRVALRDGDNEIDIDADLDIGGTPAAWTVTGRLGLGTPRFPSGRFTLEGEGDTDGVVLPSLDGELLGGTLTGEAAYRWRDTGEWSASLDLAGIDTSELFATWPAVINGGVKAAGRQRPLAVSIELADIHGTLKARPLSAAGRLAYDEDDLSADGLIVTHGGSQLRMDGSLFGEGGFDYDARIGELGEYLEGFAGGLEASGRASLNDEQPYLRINATSEAIAWNDIRVNDIVVTDRASAGDVLVAELGTGAITVAGYELDSLSLAADATRDSQEVNARIDFGDATITMAASGRLNSWSAPSAWDGQLDELELDDDDISGTLTAPANLDISETGVDAEDICVTDADALGICTDVHWSTTDGLDARLTLVSLPVNLVNDFVETKLRFDQVVSGELTWRQTPTGAVSGNANITMTAGTIINLERPEELVRTDPGELRFDVAEGNLLSGEINLPIPGLGRLAGEFDVLDVRRGPDSQVRGRLDIDIPDISTVDAVLPLVDSASGRLEADMTLAGSVASPVIAGDLSIANGGLTFLPIGLRLDEIELASRLYDSGEVELTGTFRAGEGRAEIVTRTDFAQTETTGIEVRLRGDSLSLIDVPDVQAIADADVGIVLDDEVLTINGRVAIPTARIRPRSIGVSRISESQDVVIVAGELPQAITVPEKKADVSIMGTLEVAFGSDVEVLLDVATANLTGNTSFTWSGDAMPIASGRYDVNGEVLAFGQRLDITDGGLRFPNVPADNPLIRVIAVRDIYGNSEVKQAGILVSGTAKRPDVETFTIPFTTEERALTLLLTGSDFNYEEGVGAVDFGTYIAPKVYASYGIGLFDRENVIRIRYDLARGFGITGTSGQRDSGVDLTYRFEN